MRIDQYLSKGRKLATVGWEYLRQRVPRRVPAPVCLRPAGSVRPDDTVRPADAVRPDETVRDPGTVASPIQMEVGPTDSTTPASFGITAEILTGDGPATEYVRPDPIDFGRGDDYCPLEGIVTFRGNNYRDTASFGRVRVDRGVLHPVWQVATGQVERSESTAHGGRRFWTGSGWTGQPLIVKWPDDIKSHMNIDPSKRADPDLVEVIYACMDGVVYFLDLRDGTPTRPPIRTGGGPIKGTGSICPDGTPLLFVGPADDPPGMEVVRARVYSLIDQRQVYTFGQQDPDSLRVYQSYDSSALFNAGTIVEPGENGLLYTIKLNAAFDRSSGALTVQPGAPVKLRYDAPYYADGPENVADGRWLGMEDSACAWRNYLYVADNGGRLLCVDLNTMRIVWVQDVLDDTNTSPVLEECPQDGTAYLYISTSLHITAEGQPQQGDIPIWKIDAATGAVVWRTPGYRCFRVHGVSGGVQATPVLGRHDIAGLVIYAIAHTPVLGRGLLVALDKTTGAEVWRTPLKHYSWSSPVAVYTPEGKSYIIQCDSDGNMFLIEGVSGRIVDHTYLWKNIEASPAVYGNTIVVGTRGARIFGVRIS